jgi:hypothetical protein
MADEHIATYLNDHLAGSVAALQLLEDLEAWHLNTELERFFAELRTDISADRQELESLMNRLNTSQSHTRKATAWIAGKFTELKLRLDDPAGGDLRLLEALDALASGIEGKRALWLALAAAAENTPKLRSNDYQRLVERAEEQRARVEAVRIQAARSALGSAA